MSSKPPLPWSVQEHSGANKKFAVLDANGEPVLYFDYDDVDHDQQDATADLIVRVMNRWGW